MRKISAVHLASFYQFREQVNTTGWSKRRISGSTWIGKQNKPVLVPE